MTKQDDGWEDIVKSWQRDDLESGDPTRAPARHPGDQELKAMVRRSVKAGLIQTVSSVTMGLALGGYILWEISSGLPSAYDYVLYGGILVMVVLVAFFSVWLRRGAWRAESKDTAAYVGLLHKQATSAIHVTKMGKFFGVGMFVLMYALAGLIVVQMVMSEHTIAKPGTASLIMVFVSLFFPGLVYFLHKTQRKFVARKQQLESMLESLQ